MDYQNEERENDRIRQILNETLSDIDQDAIDDNIDFEEDHCEVDVWEDTDDTDADPDFDLDDLSDVSDDEDNFDHERQQKRRRYSNNVIPCTTTSPTTIARAVTPLDTTPPTVTATTPPSATPSATSPATTPPSATPLAASTPATTSSAAIPRAVLQPSFTTPPTGRPRDDLNNPYYYKLKSKVVRAKNGHVWSTKLRQSSIRTPGRNIIVVRRGVVGTARDAITARECFEQIIDEAMLNKIILHTNNQITRVRVNYTNLTATHSLLTLDELRAFLGILVNTAACKDNHLTVRELFDNEWSGCRYKCTMNSERFELILNCLRFDDRDTRLERKRNDPFAPIRELWDDFIVNCQTKYKPGSYVTIDEQLLGFRGKCPFRMYIPNKPSKYGIKIVMGCDTTTKYMFSGIPYVGKKTQTGGEPLSDYFVKEITKPIHGTNRSVTMDNWFTSVRLAEDLLKDPYNLTLVGTIRSNRKGVPSELLNKKDRPVNTSLFLFDREKTLVSYKPKKNKVVLLLSTMHDGNQLNDQTHKPDIIHTYNETKGGVDALDQLCNNMSCSRKTQRWPLAMFFGILNISFVNAYVIYCTNNVKKGNVPANRRTFMKELFMDLCRPHMQNRLQIPTLRRGLRTLICGVLGIPDNPGQAPPPGTRKVCFYCPSNLRRMTTTYCKHCNHAICAQHKATTCVACDEGH